MADLTATSAVLNSGASLTMNAAAASQTIDYAGKADGQIFLIVENGNTGATQTATISISAGGFGLQKGLGTATYDVAYNSAKAVIGPLEGLRFKTTGNKVTVGVAVTASGTVSSVKLGVVKLPY